MICTVCHEDKPADSAYFQPDGARLRKQCRLCREAQRRNRRAIETPEKRARRLASYKDYNRENACSVAAQKARWTKENQERVRQVARNYYLKNQEKIRDRTSEWRLSNADRKLENNRRWAVENVTKQRESGRRSKAKRRLDGCIRLFEGVSEQIRTSLRSSKNGRPWERLVGYTRQDLQLHLERQFLKGMSWANYGKWHIDHIVPVSSFQFETPNDKDFLACWALTNLRPLWALENIRKKDRRIFLI